MPANTVSFRPAPSSVRQARRYVSERLRAIGFDAALFAAELLVTELVTNAILHARSTVTVTVERHGEHVRVAVGDESARAPRARAHSVEAGTGRGLMIVDKMATRWGVELRDGGKVVWFELSREPVIDLDGLDDVWEA
jgi:anti-sigma regulatory factor (Ser/Thr protein kinase)